MKKILFLLLTSLIILSCKGEGDVVHDNYELIIIEAAKNQFSHYNDGIIPFSNYKYKVMDGTTRGWTYYSNAKYNVGDTLVISKK